MAIELKIGTRGTREDFEDTYTRGFLENNGLLKFDPRNFAVNCVWGVHTKVGWMCSFSYDDILTYMGDGIWDLRVAKENKLTDLEDMEREYKAEEHLPLIKHEIKVRSTDGRDQK